MARRKRGELITRDRNSRLTGRRVRSIPERERELGARLTKLQTQREIKELTNKLRVMRSKS
jgi:hypothetical protein